MFNDGAFACSSDSFSKTSGVKFVHLLLRILWCGIRLKIIIFRNLMGNNLHALHDHDFMEINDVEKEKRNRLPVDGHNSRNDDLGMGKIANTSSKKSNFLLLRMLRHDE